MRPFDTVYFSVLTLAGVLILGDTKFVLDKHGRSMALPMVQHGAGGLVFLVFGVAGLLTDATTLTQIPGPWIRYDSTAVVSSIGVLSPLALLVLILPPRRHLESGPSPTLLRLIERFS